MVKAILMIGATGPDPSVESFEPRRFSAIGGMGLFTARLFTCRDGWPTASRRSIGAACLTLTGRRGFEMCPFESSHARLPRHNQWETSSQYSERERMNWESERVTDLTWVSGTTTLATSLMGARARDGN